MKAKVQLTPSIQLEIDEPKEMDTLHKAIALSNYRRKCNLCGNVKAFRLASNKPKGYTYVKNICLQCGGQSNLGQYEAGGYFWKEFEKYEPNNKGTNQG